MSQKESPPIYVGKEQHPTENIDEGVIAVAGTDLAKALASLGEGVSLLQHDFVITAQSRLLTERFGDLRGTKCYEGYLDLAQPCDNCPLKGSSDPASSEPIEVKAKDLSLIHI